MRCQMKNQFTILKFKKFMEKYENGSFNTPKEIILDLDKIDRSIINSIRYAGEKIKN